MRKPTERENVQKDNVLKKCFECLIETGIEGASIKDFSNATGMTASSLYYWFTDKDEIVLDATVPLETAIGGKPFRFIDLMEGSAADRTASSLAGTGAKVICAFCNISNSHLANIPEEIDCDCLIAGDDKEAKEIAAEIIDKIPGVRTIDTGILEKARIIEKITPLLIGMNIKYKSHYGGLRITGIPALDKDYALITWIHLRR